MSATSRNSRRAPSAGSQKADSLGRVQDHAPDHSKAYQDIPSSAHEYNQQKRKDSPRQDENKKYMLDQTASALTAQAMTRFQKQPHNNLQALNDRVVQYRKSSPLAGESKKTAEEHQRHLTDSMKAWSDEWERLGRK